MNRVLKFMTGALPTVLLVVGAAAVSAGVAMIWPPIGIITVGILTMVGGVLLILGNGGSKT